MTSGVWALVPTRSRPQHVQRMTDAWFETRSFPDAELVFVIDADDAQLHEYEAAIRKAQAYRGGQIHVLKMPTWQPLVPKLNAAVMTFVEEASAIVFMGDDHVPRTNKWTQQLAEAHRGRRAGIVYGQDGYQDENLPTWWSMDSRIVSKLGRMVPADVQHMYCDNSIKALGIAADCLVYRDSILVEHMHPVAAKADWDPQYVRVNRHQQYESDRVAFHAWLANGLARDATLIADIWG